MVRQEEVLLVGRLRDRNGGSLFWFKELFVTSTILLK